MLCLGHNICISFALYLHKFCITFSLILFPRCRTVPADPEGGLENGASADPEGAAPVGDVRPRLEDGACFTMKCFIKAASQVQKFF